MEVGKIADFTLAQIRELDAGSWFDPSFAGAKVPTVDEVLTLVADHNQHEVLIEVVLNRHHGIARAGSLQKLDLGSRFIVPSMTDADDINQ